MSLGLVSVQVPAGPPICARQPALISESGVLDSAFSFLLCAIEQDRLCGSYTRQVAMSCMLLSSEEIEL